MKNSFKAMALAAALAISALSSDLYAGSRGLGSFPKGKSPEEVGLALSRKFLATPHTRFGNPRPDKPATYITYPDVCAWLGSLWMAEVTGEKELLDSLADYFEPLFGEEASWRPRTNHVDHNVFGSVPLEIYMNARKEQRFLDLGLRYADTQWECPDDAKDEQKAHAARGYSWQTRLWIDDMFMITTVQSQAYKATGDPRYIERAAREMVMYLDEIQRPNGLFYHTPDTPYFWARGNGWMAAGMAELLSILPEDNPCRGRIMEAYRLMMDTLLANQAKSGLWRQLIDQSDSWEETSGSAMFTYGMIVGVRNGWLKGRKYVKSARKGWLALVDKLNEDGELVDVCEGTNAKSDKQYYLDRKHITGDLHGHAPMIWCAVELCR